MANVKKKNIKRNEIIHLEKLLEVCFEDSGSELKSSDSEVNENESPAF